MSDLSQIRNYIRVSDNIASSGQPLENQFDAIAQAGFTTVMNIAMPDSDNAIAGEGRIVTSLGMSYVHLPVPFDDPKMHHLRKFMRIMQALGGEKIWVHCAMNYRVSAFLCVYLKSINGTSAEKIFSPVLSQWHPNEKWRRILHLDPAEIGT